MIDAATAVQEAVYAALNAAIDPSLAAVWQNPPEDTPPPLVIIGDISLEPIGGKDGGLDRATFDVLAFTREPDRSALSALQAAIRDALDGQPITATGALLSAPSLLSSEGELTEDGETYQGLQRFETIVQPA